MATAKVLVIGGGAGGGRAGGGGAAGGYQYDATHTITYQAYSVTVGAGGTSGNGGGTGTNGGNSVFNTITAIGGGKGSSYAFYAPGNGGSGGGGATGNTTGGTGTAGQGFAGGNANSGIYEGGGGGGSSAAGANSGSNGAGGNGTSNSITGSAVTYAGGGAGAGASGSGGTGGGGNADANGTDGLGGGGGGGSNGVFGGGTGGSGVVIIRYLTSDFPQGFTGGTKSTVGGDTVHVFTTSGTLAPVPTVTTQAVSSIAATTATGNGNITATGGSTPDERGIVYSTASHADPGNTAPAASLYSGLSNSTGSFGTGAFTNSLTGLTSRTTYYARAYAHNSGGYSYGSEVSFTTIGFTNPGNIYASDNTYATLAASSGALTVELSKDAGATWTIGLVQTFTGSDTLKTYGNGSTELWGTSFTRADMIDAQFRVRLSQGSISQVYKTFGFSTGSEILTGVEVAVEGNFVSTTLSLDLLKVKIYYGTSALPVQAGSQAYASNGRKNGEGVGSGTGVLCFYDGTAWRACDTGATVAA